MVRGKPGRLLENSADRSLLPQGMEKGQEDKRLSSPGEGSYPSSTPPGAAQTSVCSEGLPWSTAISIPWVVERGEGERQTGAGGKDGEEEEEGNEEEEEEEEEIFFSVAILNVKSENTQERQARKYMQDIEHAPF